MKSVYPWQLKQWEILQKAIRQNRLPHAILCSGIEGIGKLDFALIFAANILCKCDNSTEKPCGICEVCQLLLANNHPDLYLLQPEEKGHAIKIEQVRNVINELTKSAFLDGFKIVIIEPAEMLNISASNALLKTLEEPTPNTIFILVSSQPAKLIPTIISRCQQLKFPTPSLQQGKSWLQNKIADNTDLDLVLSLAEHAPLRALEYLQSDFLPMRDLFFNALMEVINNKISVIEFAERLKNSNLLGLLNLFYVVILDVSKTKQDINIKITNSDKITFIQYVAARLQQAGVDNLLEKITKMFTFLANNLNQQLVLEELALTLKVEMGNVN